jgi:hypothetical protein
MVPRVSKKGCVVTTAVRTATAVVASASEASFAREQDDPISASKAAVQPFILCEMIARCVPVMENPR